MIPSNFWLFLKRLFCKINLIISTEKKTVAGRSHKKVKELKNKKAKVYIHDCHNGEVGRAMN